MPTFSTLGATIYYEKLGAWGTSLHCPVLLLHGNGEDMSTFFDTIEPIKKRFPFLAMDSRGQGRSVFSVEPKISYQLMADDAYALIKSLDIKECDIVGFSDGAIVALMLAMNKEYLHVIRRVIAIGANTSPSGIKPLALAGMKKERDRARAKGDTTGVMLFDMMLTSPDISSKELANICCQCTIVAGSSDVIKPAHTKSIADAIMRSRLITINGAGHMIPQEKPERLRAIISDELQ